MEIFLVRHTSVSVPKSVCYGQTDVGLADTFLLESEQTINQLSKYLHSDFQIVSSPLSRCFSLAKALQKQFPNIAIEQDDRLMEMNFGDWEMQSWDEIPRESSEPWMNDFVNMPAPNGESFLALSERLNKFLTEKIAIQKTTPQIVIMAHGGIIRAALSYFAGLPLENAFKFDIKYGSITKISVKGNFTKIDYVNL
jgi:alpha-ribazole phosphatase